VQTISKRLDSDIQTDLVAVFEAVGQGLLRVVDADGHLVDHKGKAGGKRGKGDILLLLCTP
jgi:hypothetical protein